MRYYRIRPTTALIWAWAISASQMNDGPNAEKEIITGFKSIIKIILFFPALCIIGAIINGIANINSSININPIILMLFAVLLAIALFLRQERIIRNAQKDNEYFPDHT